MKYEKIIEQLHAQHETMRKGAIKNAEQVRNYSLAAAYRDCRMFDYGHTQTTDELVELLKQPQAIEVCLRFGFPSIEIFRALDSEDAPQRYGVYIDRGEVEINEPQGIIYLIGNTTATITCSDLRIYKIICMHGAKAIINAKGWAMVYVQEQHRCHNAVINITDNAIQL